MRVTRAALRAGKVHEDIYEDEEDCIRSSTSPPSEQTVTPQTPKAVFLDITSKNVLSPVAQKTLEFHTLKFISKDEEHTPVSKTPKATPRANTHKTLSTPAALHKTPKFDPEVHHEVKSSPEDENPDDSTQDDSFVEHIIARSPAKPAPRIEDSVEAMDALEDAIEEVSQNLPLIDEMELQSPIKTHKATPKTASKSVVMKASPMVAVSTPRKSAVKPTPVARKSSQVKKVEIPHIKTTPATRKSSPVKKLEVPPVKAASTHISTANSLRRATAGVKATISRPSIANPTKLPSPPVKPTTRPLAARMSTTKSKSDTLVVKLPAKPAANTMQKRKVSSSLSTSKPGFVPTKSSKAATTSTFVLPGEAIAAKLKAQRDERQKREEAADLAKKPSKAKSIQTKAPKVAPLPRQTKTSQARLSMMAPGNKNKAATGVTSAPTKNDSRLTVVKRGSMPVKPNSAIRRSTIVPSGASIAPLGEKTLSGDELRARAKKAREEAAEKGRLASREWAEKQRKRSSEATTKAKLADEKSAEVVAA